MWSDNKCKHGLCAFPNMVSNVNTMRKSGKKGETWCKVVDNVKVLRYSLHGLCAFPNMVIKLNIARKSEKNQKKIEIYDVDHCQQCWCIVYMVCAHFLIW